MKTILPDGAAHCRRFAEVAACRRRFVRDAGRMRHGRWREQGMQVGSGVAKGGCRASGMWTARPGTRRPESANAMPALKSLTMDLRLPGFAWQANQAMAA